MELDVRRLRLLREVALRGTITAAADALGFTPSAVSQQLSALERESGTALLQHVGRRIRLTDAGNVLVSRTEPILVALEEAKAALEEGHRTLAAELRIAACGSVARALVIPVLNEVVGSHPELQVTMLEQDGAEMMRDVRLGELDLVVANDYDHEPQPPEAEVVRDLLFAEDMLVAAPVGRFGPPLALGDLAGEVWAAEPARSTCGHAQRSACRAAGFEPDVRFESSEFGVILSAVAAGAVSLLPRLGFAGAPPGVEAIPLAQGFTRRLVFAAHRRGRLRPSVAFLLERLHAAAEQLSMPSGVTPAARTSTQRGHRASRPPRPPARG